MKMHRNVECGANSPCGDLYSACKPMTEVLRDAVALQYVCITVTRDIYQTCGKTVQDLSNALRLAFVADTEHRRFIHTVYALSFSWKPLLHQNQRPASHSNTIGPTHCAQCAAIR